MILSSAGDWPLKMHRIKSVILKGLVWLLTNDSVATSIRSPVTTSGDRASLIENGIVSWQSDDGERDWTEKNAASKTNVRIVRRCCVSLDAWRR